MFTADTGGGGGAFRLSRPCPGFVGWGRNIISMRRLITDKDLPADVENKLKAV
jgi:hypothetical protein